VEAAPEPGSRRADLLVLVGPGRPAGVDDRDPAQPLAVQAVQEPSQGQELVGDGGVGEPVQVLGGQLVEAGGHGGQPPRPYRRD
jgi:hypothetical protein